MFFSNKPLAAALLLGGFVGVQAISVTGNSDGDQTWTLTIDVVNSTEVLFPQPYATMVTPVELRGITCVGV